MALLKAVFSNAPLEDIDRLATSKSVLEVDDCRRNALHIACQMDRLALVEMLIAKKMNVNAQDSNGWTPLHVAASNSNYAMCLALLNAKAIKPNTTNSDFNTPLVYICKRSAGTPMNRGEYHECLRVFIDKGADINTKNKNGETPLHYACLGANIDAVDFLLRHGADVNVANKFLDLLISSHLITSHHITSHHITSHHITSHHITSHHISSHHISSHHISF